MRSNIDMSPPKLPPQESTNYDDGCVGNIDQDYDNQDYDERDCFSNAIDIFFISGSNRRR